MKKYYGTEYENFIFWRNTFEDHSNDCQWDDETGVVQLKRALAEQALHEFLDQGPFTTTTEALNALQDHFIGADAHREYSRMFRTLVQQENESVQHFLGRFTDLLHCCNFLAPSPQDRISEADQLNRFLDALNTDVDTTVSLARVSTMTEAIAIAKQAENTTNKKRKLPQTSFIHRKQKRQKHHSRHYNSDHKKLDSHSSSDQPACTICHKKGHDENSCWQKHPHLKPKSKARFASVISTRPNLPISVNNMPISALVDSGSTETIISKTLFDYLCIPIQKTDKSCSSVNGSLIKIVGKASVSLKLIGLFQQLMICCTKFLKTRYLVR